MRVACGVGMSMDYYYVNDLIFNFICAGGYWMCKQMCSEEIFFFFELIWWTYTIHSPLTRSTQWESSKFLSFHHGFMSCDKFSWLNIVVLKMKVSDEWWTYFFFFSFSFRARTHNVTTGQIEHFPHISTIRIHYYISHIGRMPYGFVAQPYSYDIRITNPPHGSKFTHQISYCIASRIWYAGVPSCRATLN